MKLDIARARHLLKVFDFKTLFIEELGWNHYNNQIEVILDGFSFMLSGVAEKHGMVVFTCSPLPPGHITDYSARRKIEKQAAKAVHEHIIIYTDSAGTAQIWQWVKREAGKPTACREHTYHINQPGDSLLQKLQAIAFSIEEEDSITIVDVAGRAKSAFDVERVTKRFYDRFKTEHDAFLKFISGIPDDELHRWYASVMLNRLMFIYFIQKKGFLNNDDAYLKNKLAQSKATGRDNFYKDFLCPLFFEGFAKKDADRSAKMEQLLGEVPYLNGGLFLKHQIEELHDRHIVISDEAFEKLFDFFDQYQWYLDERPLKRDNEINPDVLGYIFEKYINQKQMGAYYTKEDITEYISKNTVIPFLFDAAKDKCKIAFDAGAGLKTAPTVWQLLQTDPDRYFYPAVKKGVELSLPPEIEAGLTDVSKRTGWNKTASPEYALPTEIWRDVVARRQRYEEVKTKMLKGELQAINDLITYNLDIRQFAQDVIENSEGPELLRAFYHAIEKVTVLDPTCGSGAFLFAALNILEPLYEACLDRMQVFLDELELSKEKHRSDKYGDFKKILKRVEEHPNSKYFIYKSIIVNNLYGVDIMEEAIEICKLRLFLKLVAQIDSAERIEPLPDIDFNIRAGNTLVGFAKLEEIKKAMEGDWIKLQSLPVIEENAELADRAFRLFKEMQTDQEMQSEDFSSAKLELRKRLYQLEGELNRYLANEYGADPKKRAAYEKWLKTHLPFHWFIEFYGILKNGGFDVIIGNPPYVEYSKVKDDYTIRGYETESCGNLYAFVIERVNYLIANKGFCGMIVPMSGHSTDRMAPLVNEFYDKAKLLYLMNISGDAHPSVLFPGVKFRLAIFIANKSLTAKQLYTTRYLKWFAEERNDLFSNLQYVDIQIRPFGLLPKLAALTHQNLIKKMSLIKTSIGLCSGQHITYYHNTPVSWIRAHPFVPYFSSERDGEKISTQLKVIACSSEAQSLAVTGIICSSLFYIWWITTSDCYHLNKREIDSFPLKLDDNKFLMEMPQLVNSLLADLQKNSKRRVYIYQTSGRVEYDEFYPKHSKHIIDKIDRVLAKHYGFTDEELDFIINYDIKYRMGREIEEDE